MEKTLSATMGNIGDIAFDGGAEVGGHVDGGLPEGIWTEVLIPPPVARSWLGAQFQAVSADQLWPRPDIERVVPPTQVM